MNYDNKIKEQYNKMKFQIGKHEWDENIYELKYGDIGEGGAMVFRCMKHNLIQLRELLNSIDLDKE